MREPSSRRQYSTPVQGLLGKNVMTNYVIPVPEVSRPARPGAPGLPNAMIQSCLRVSPAISSSFNHRSNLIMER